VNEHSIDIINKIQQVIHFNNTESFCIAPTFAFTKVISRSEVTKLSARSCARETELDSALPFQGLSPWLY